MLSPRPVAQYPFRLDGEPKGNFRFAVEDLQKLIAEHAMEFTLWSLLGNEFNAAVARIAFGTGDVGFSHVGVDSTPFSVVLRRNPGAKLGPC